MGSRQATISISDGFAERRRERKSFAVRALRQVYGARSDFDDFIARLDDLAARAFDERPLDLKRLDLERRADPTWFQRSDRIGYAAYVDRFAGDLKGVAARIAHLKRIGVTYLHLLPLLRMRDGDNDGGFAVSDYRSVEPRFGSFDDLKSLACELRRNGVSLCLDLVLNHTSDDHPWANSAKAGDAGYRDYYHFFPDRTLPDQFERYLSEVFPQTAPGNFTLVEELGGWVWTTFYPYQWDLNYANPAVFEAMLDNLFHLANAGVEVFRLDAAPYIWKRPGTTSCGQPEVFAVIRALRAMVEIVAPGVLLKAEAIVPSRQLAKFVEVDRDGGGTCQLAYNATLMAALWDALATGGVANLIRVVNNSPRLNPGTTWLTYVRCHDDIGWGNFAGDLAAAGGEEAVASVRRLQHFFSTGAGTFADGAPYQEAGTVGATASLCGLDRALAARDDGDVDRAVSRILVLYTALYAYGGTPLINMGDEVGIRNYRAFKDDPRFDGDDRWLHRGAMPSPLAEERDGVEGRLTAGFERLARCRIASKELDGSEAVCAGSPDGRTLLLSHQGERGELIVAVNFADEPSTFSLGVGKWRDLLTDSEIPSGIVALSAYERRWLRSESE